MTIAHLLEDFGVVSAHDSVGKFMDEESLEDFRLNAFEQGYAAGWEDCAAAQEKEHLRLTASLGNRLEDLSFTYQEAISHLLISVEPIFEILISKALPTAMARTKGEVIVQHLVDMTRVAIDTPVQIAIPPGSSSSVAKLVSDQSGMAVEVIEDASLLSGQADIRIGQSTREIDSERMLACFSDAIDAFYHLIREETQNG